MWFYLEMNVRDDRKIVEIWLTNAEKKDEGLRKSLEDIYDKYKNTKYHVAVFESGEKDLYQGTLDLLAYNKRRIAELEVKKEKQAEIWYKKGMSPERGIPMMNLLLIKFYSDRLQLWQRISSDCNSDALLRYITVKR